MHEASWTREQLDALAEEIAALSLKIDIAKHTLLTNIRTFDAHDGWTNSGFISTASWLAWRIEIGPTAAREHLRVARALGELPLTDAAFAAGKLSYSKVRAITRAATPETEQDFIDVATHATAAQIEKLAAAYRRVRVDPSEPTTDLRRFMRRFEMPSGMVRIEIQLPPEQANVIWEAVTTALDRADPAESASAEAPADPVVVQSERADALVSVAQAYLQQRPPTLGSGYELVVMTTKEQLEHGPGGVGGFLRDGTPVPLHIARMLACDCSRVDVETSETGEILDVGRARRSVPSAIGRSLWLRDGGCRVPGCGRKRHLHAHHIEAWAEGGKTSTSNLVLLCPSHHALVHEGTLSVDVREGKVEFRNASGLRLRPAPRESDGIDEAERWVHRDELGFERSPLWDGSPLRLGEAVGWMLAAHASAEGREG